MPWGFPWKRTKENNDKQTENKKKGGSSSSKSPKAKAVNTSSPSTNRVTKTRARAHSTPGDLEKTIKTLARAGAPDSFGSTKSFPAIPIVPIPTNTPLYVGSRLFGSEHSNFQTQRPLLSPSELAIQKRNQRQAALAARKAQEEHDDAIRLATARRVDPAVTPGSDEFQTVLFSFRHHLDKPKSTLNELLNSRFSPEDRDLLKPADWEQNSVLAELQGRNSEAYQRLIKGEVKGWQKPTIAKGKKGEGKKKGADEKGWAKEADLAFKLTCLYFGLPIKPMGWEQSDTNKWWEKKQQQQMMPSQEKGYGLGYDEVEDEWGTVIRKQREDPIKFLNCYGRRYFEKDAIRETDPVLETYNALPQLPEALRQLDPERDYINVDALRRVLPENLGLPGKLDFPSSIGLRGGGNFDDENEEIAVDELMELIPSPQNALVSLRGGGPLSDMGGVFKDMDKGKYRLSAEAFYAFARTEHHKDGLKHRLEGERGGVENLWIPLYGYQGIVWFHIGQLNTFVDAVDRLLGFGVRAGASYKLYLFDKNKEYNARAQKEAFLRNNRNTLDVACKGPGDYSNDHVAWNWAIGHLGSLGTDSNGLPLAHQKVLFVAGPNDPIPYQWEPTAEHNVAKLILEWDGMPDMNRPDVAYLRMPISGDPTEADVHTNQYAPWMAQACRLLCAGRIPNRPGQSLVPDAYIGLGAADNDGFGTYGGLTFNYNQWLSILQAHRDSPGEPVVLRAWTSESPTGNTDRWHLFIPGVSYQYTDNVAILHSEFKDSEAITTKIRTLLETGLGLNQVQDLAYIEVHLPGESFLADAREQSEILISVDTKGKLDKAGVQRLSELLEQWYNWLREKPGVPPAENGVDMFPQFVTLQPVYREYALVCDEDVETVVEWNTRETTLDEFRMLVEELWQPGRFSVDYNPETSRVRLSQRELPGAPSLVVTPMTTKSEWNLIRDLVVWPDLVVQVYGDLDDVFGDELFQPFGYRDIYKTDGVVLYSSLSNKDSLPNENSLRYGRDYQLWAEEVPWVHGELRTFQPSDRQPLPAPGGIAPYQPRMAQAAVGDQPVPTVIGFAQNLPPPRPTHTGVFSVSRKLDLNAMNSSEKGRFLREFSYANPLTVAFTKDLPVHIPPIDQVLDCKFDNTPRLANGVLTPNEARILQHKYFEMRSVILERLEKCHFKGCDASFPYNSNLWGRHIRDAHTAEKCNFCGDLLYQHWTVAQRFQHFATKHANILGALQSARLVDASASNDDHPNPFQLQRELTWGFCCRCGRDHSVLASRVDRFHHDLVCYPGASHHEIHPWKACTVCGERIHLDDLSSAKAHKHPEVLRGAGWRPNFCPHCALEMRKLDVADREKHTHFCRGHCIAAKVSGERSSTSFNARFCSWCGIEMELIFKSGDDANGNRKEVDVVAAHRHMNWCSAKPSGDDKRVFSPLHPVSHMAYYYGIPRGAQTARLDLPQGVVPLKQWLGGSGTDTMMGGDKRRPIRAKRGVRVGPPGATDLTFTQGTVAPAGFFGLDKDGTENGVAGPGPDPATADATKKARFADVVEEVEPEDEEMSDLSILSEDEQKAAKKAGKRPARTGGKRKRADSTTNDPTYKPTWSWPLSDHSSEFSSDDEETTARPSAAKKAKTVPAVEPAEVTEKPRKVAFKPTGKGGKKKLAPFQSEDPSYKPPKSHSDESELSDADAAADPLDISLWPEPIEVVKFDEPEEEEEEDKEPAPPPPAKTKGKGATKNTTPAQPPRPAKTQAMTAAAQKAAAKAAAAEKDSIGERVIMRAPPKILPTIHGIREPNSDATPSSSEAEEESDEEPPTKGRGRPKGKAGAKKVASVKAAACGRVTTRGKAKQAEAEQEENEDKAQSPVSSPTALDQDAEDVEEEERPSANPSPAIKVMKAKINVIRPPNSPLPTRRGVLNAKMMHMHKDSKMSNISNTSSTSKKRSRGRSRPKVSLSPNPKLFGKGTSPDPLQVQSQTDFSFSVPSSQAQTEYQSRLAHLSHLKARFHNLTTNPPPPPSHIDYDSPLVTRAREQRMLRDAFTSAGPSAPVHPGSPWAALQRQADAQQREDGEYFTLKFEKYHKSLAEQKTLLLEEIAAEERALSRAAMETRQRERRARNVPNCAQLREHEREVEILEQEFEKVKQLQLEARRRLKEKYKNRNRKNPEEEGEETMREVMKRIEEMERREAIEAVEKAEEAETQKNLARVRVLGRTTTIGPTLNLGYDEEEEYEEEYEERRLRSGKRHKGKEREGQGLPPPAKVTDEDLEALARSYPGAIA